MRQIDHVFASDGLIPGGAHAPSTPLARRASDHLPLVADFTLAAPAPWPSPAPAPTG